VPRFFGVGRGPISEYCFDRPTADSPEPIGHIPQTENPEGTFGYWEAASGIANEKGVMIGECTCSAVFGATIRTEARGKGPLLGYMELTRIALERCATAREAVELMGSLALEHGFGGNTPELSGAAESLAVVDGSEAWVFHVLPDDTGTSAIWGAQRLPEGHAACVPNVFTIRAMEGLEADADHDAESASGCFLLSANAKDVAASHGLWAPGTPFDFARTFSSGEARHRYYSGRRQWRVLSLLAPSLQLPATYGDLLTEEPYPFSVIPEEPLDAARVMAIMRDTYEGTPYDASADVVASGPFGLGERFDGFTAATSGEGFFDRPIGIYRMAYSYVCEPAAAAPATAVVSAADSGGGGGGGGHGAGGGRRRSSLFHFAPHASVTWVYLPVLCSMQAAPPPLATGTVRAVDRSSAYWAFRVVKHTARGLPWDRCLGAIRARQRRWEAEATSIVDNEAGVDAAKVCDLATAVVDDWWALHDELLVRYGDGWEHEWAEDGESRCKPIEYPREWLEKVGFFDKHV
jgi:dipeptidase